MTARITREQAHQQIEQYFASFNQQQFDKTAGLFDTDGILHPPFEKPLQGRENVLAYLNSNATNMRATPQKWELTPSETGDWQTDIQGSVVTAHFKVNVSWEFCLTPSGDIAKVRIKLLASLAELVALR